MSNDKNTSSNEAALINVEVAFALPDRQKIIALQVQQGCTAYQAAELSAIDKQFSEIDLSKMKIGVFGKTVKPHDYVMHAGDRVEIYRPLIADPKASRKARADKAQAGSK